MSKTEYFLMKVNPQEVVTASAEFDLERLLALTGNIQQLRSSVSDARFVYKAAQKQEGGKVR